MPLTKKQKSLWMTAADIPENTVFMMSEPCKFFIQEWPRLGLGRYIKEYFTYFQGDFSQMHYRRDEFDAEADFLSQKMLRSPAWAIGLIRRVERWSTLFMQRSKQLRSRDLRRLTDAQLIAAFNSCIRYHRLSHGVGGSVSWHADAEKERVTRAIWHELEEHLWKRGSSLQIADIFSVLTTPIRESFVAKEEQDFLTVAAILFKQRQVRLSFRKFSGERLIAKLQSDYPRLYGLVYRHYQTYCWLAYQYKGPATPFEDYLDRWRELVRGANKPQVLLQKARRQRTAVLRQQRRLAKALRLTPRLRLLLRLAQAMVFIKDYRKDALYHGMYSYEPLFREVGRRLGLTLNQIWAMNAWEFIRAIGTGRVNADELNARQRLAVVYATPRKYVVYAGDRAKRFLRGVRFEQKVVSNTSELTGTPACSGIVRGTVKVINVPSEMHKMAKGDILVAHNTNPNLVPAMKKAAALVSEAGGLTCHTAIVARELRIPCIVGVAGADKVLKDGDQVEVNATHGKVKKL